MKQSSIRGGLLHWSSGGAETPSIRRGRIAGETAVSVPALWHPRYRRERLRGMLLWAAMGFLLAGILLYAFFRERGLLLFSVTGTPPFWENLPRRSLPDRPWWNFLCYNVPGGLWLLSGMVWIRALWLEPGTQGGVYVFLFCSLALLLEALQGLRVIPGTFDPVDMLTLAVTACGESIWYTRVIYRRIQYAY